MLLDASQAFIVLHNKLQQRLASSSAQGFEIGREVGRDLHLRIVFEALVQNGQDLIHRTRRFCFLQVVVLQDAPDRPL